MKLTEITRRWPDNETAMAHLERVRWKGQVTCPYCGSERTGPHASKDKTLPRWQCHDCHRAFSATVGTIFHHTHLPLQTWFLALAIMLNAKKGVSNAQLSRDLDLPYKTAWSLALRIRKAMMTDPAQRRLFHGIVEMDETYVGGKPRKGNRKTAPQEKAKPGRGTKKMPVVGIVERDGSVSTKVFDKRDLNAAGLLAFCRRVVDTATSVVITDQFQPYRSFKKHMAHRSINHGVAYAIGDTHTNTIEGFWALVKRQWYGQHHFYSRKWADHYICETAFKYNHRKNEFAFDHLLQHMAGVCA